MKPSLAEITSLEDAPADVLAAMYELARYAPKDEPLTPEEMRRARGCLCTLAAAA